MGGTAFSTESERLRAPGDEAISSSAALPASASAVIAPRPSRASVRRGAARRERASEGGDGERLVGDTESICAAHERFAAVGRAIARLGDTHPRNAGSGGVARRAHHLAAAAVGLPALDRRRHGRADAGVRRRVDRLLAVRSPTERRAWPERQAGDLQLSRLHAPLREDAKREVSPDAANHATVAADQASRAEEHLDATSASAIPILGKWLGSVVRGYFAYHRVPTNIKAMQAFRTQVERHWGHALSHRSQRGRLTWATVHRLSQRWLPAPKIMHPWPGDRFDVRTRGRSRVR